MVNSFISVPIFIIYSIWLDFGVLFFLTFELN